MARSHGQWPEAEGLGSPVVRKLPREQPHVRSVSTRYYACTNFLSLWLAPLHLPVGALHLPLSTQGRRRNTRVSALSVILLPPAGRCWVHGQNSIQA